MQVLRITCFCACIILAGCVPKSSGTGSAVTKESKYTKAHEDLEEKAFSLEELNELKMRAQSGDVAAQIRLGNRLLKGDGSVKDLNAAVHWFSLAAEKGDPYAANQLGAFYDDGLGVPRNAKKAYDWYLRSVEFSSEMLKEQADPAPLPLRTMHAVACFNVGNCLYRGEGVSKDDRATVDYLAKAAVEFFPARNLLAEMASRGNREAGLALEQSIRMGNELSAIESLLTTRKFSEHLQSLKRRGIKFEMIVGHNTPDHVTIRIRPSPPSSKVAEQIFFYGTKDRRCFVGLEGGKMREIQ